MDLKRAMMEKNRSNGANLRDAEVTMRKKRKMSKKERLMEKEKRRERRREMREKRKLMKMEKQKQKSGDQKVNCMVTPWTEWEECTQTCGKQYVTRSRMIKRQPENGGKECPRKLSRRRKCRGLPKCRKFGWNVYQRLDWKKNFFMH